MSKDPFEEAHRAMERAHRKFEETMLQAHDELRAAMEEIHRRMAAEARRRPGGRWDGPSSGGMGARGWRPRGPLPKGPGGQLPMPVKPDRPNLLSGGAEVPLED